MILDSPAFSILNAVMPEYTQATYSGIPVYEMYAF